MSEEIKERNLQPEDPTEDVEMQPEETEEQAENAETAAANDVDAEQPTLQEALQNQAREDEAERSSTFTLRKILGGDFLTTNMLRRQIGVILLALAFTIIYISNRYSCQKSLIEIDRLNVELQDAKYKALSTSSELTERCRESNVLNALRNSTDTTLHVPSQPPYIVNVPE